MLIQYAIDTYCLVFEGLTPRTGLPISSSLSSTPSGSQTEIALASSEQGLPSTPHADICHPSSKDSDSHAAKAAGMQSVVVVYLFVQFFFLLIQCMNTAVAAAVKLQLHQTPEENRCLFSGQGTRQLLTHSPPQSVIKTNPTAVSISTIQSMPAVQVKDEPLNLDISSTRSKSGKCRNLMT